VSLAVLVVPVAVAQLVEPVAQRQQLRSLKETRAVALTLRTTPTAVVAVERVALAFSVARVVLD
jgi:hypothetical protein